MPALMTARYERFFYTSITAGELRDLARYISGRRAVGFYAKLHVLPGYRNRTGLLRTIAPSWVMPGGAEDPEATIDALGGEGTRIRPSMPDADRRAEDARVSAGYAAILADYRIDPGADRALRDLLRACHSNGTKAVVIRTPESTTFRAAYRPDALATLDTYTAGLRGEFGVQVVDARRLARRRGIRGRPSPTAGWPGTLHRPATPRSARPACRYRKMTAAGDSPRPTLLYFTSRYNATRCGNCRCRRGLFLWL